MSSETTNNESCEPQIKRLEDLIRFFIQKRKDGVQFNQDLTKEKLDGIQFIRKTIVSGLVGLISILIALTALLNYDPNIMVSIIITLIIITVLSHWLYLRKHRKMGDLFGLLISAYDTGVSNHETVLEYLIVGTLDSYTANKNSIHELGDFVMILEQLNTLYLVEPWKQLSKTDMTDKSTLKTMSTGSQTLAENFDKVVEDYDKLNKDLIPTHLQKFINSVIDELKSSIKK